MVLVRAAIVSFGVAAAVVLAGAAVAQKGDDKKDKGEVVKAITDVTVSYSKDRKEFVVTATGTVPTGGWSGAKLTRRDTKKAPADGVYEYDLTAVKPSGIAIQVISEVKATDRWKTPPADIKGVKVYGVGENAKTVKVEK